MPKKTVAVLSGVGYGAVKYTMTPLPNDRAEIEIDFSQSRVDQMPELKKMFLEPFGGQARRELTKEEALSTLEQMVDWAAASGAILRGEKEDLLFIQHDIVLTIMREMQKQQEQQKDQPEATAAEEGGDAGQVQSDPLAGTVDLPIEQSIEA